MDTDYQWVKFLIRSTIWANGGFSTMFCFTGGNPCIPVANYRF